MYRVAASTLRGAGRVAEAEDVVTNAMLSLMEKPPRLVKNWEAILVRVTKRRALDHVNSAAVRNASGTELMGHDGAAHGTLEDDVIEAIDRQRAAAKAWAKLSILDERYRYVAREYVAEGRPRDEIAAELGVSPARVSQMATRALMLLEDALKNEGVTP